MRISGFEKRTNADRIRVSAIVSWEEHARPKQEIFFETDHGFSSDLDINPNSFLLASVVPAMRFGEHRILVEGEVCPQLRNGLITAMQVLSGWYGPPRQGPVVIEATQGFHPPQPRSIKRTASFMSGGVDSLATLRTNRVDFPPGHFRAIQDCLFVHGFDLGGYIHWDRNLENFDSALALMRDFAREAEMTIIPVYTNLRHLEGDSASPDNNPMFSRESHGAALASVAHAFSKRITSVLIPATDRVADLTPWGSHPLLDPNYASAEMQVEHDGIRMSRLEKVRLISRWQAALRVLRSCLNPMRGGHEINCGKCEKCLRTMVHLLIFGKLQDCTTFPLDDISADYLNEFLHGSPTEAASPYAALAVGRDYFWSQLINPLKALGRYDLVKVVESKLREFERYQRRLNRRSAMRQFDQRFLQGTASKLKRWVRS